MERRLQRRSRLAAHGFQKRCHHPAVTQGQPSHVPSPKWGRSQPMEGWEGTLKGDLLRSPDVGSWQMFLKNHPRRPSSRLTSFS